MIADAIHHQTEFSPPKAKDQNKSFGLSPDILIFSLLVAGINLPLLWGSITTSLIFLPDQAASGNGWGTWLHPFVHLSGYHLLLDAGAFFLLYTGLSEQRIPVKLFYVAVCGGSSLLFALIFSPALKTQGLCGLSGIAHGLMAVSSLEMMREEGMFRAGAFSLLMVSGKSLYEFFTGQVLFSFLQFDLCGTAVAVCHTGGWAGGIIAFFIINSSVFHDFNRPGDPKVCFSLHLDDFVKSPYRLSK